MVLVCVFSGIGEPIGVLFLGKTLPLSEFFSCLSFFVLDWGPKRLPPFMLAFLFVSFCSDLIYATILVKLYGYSFWHCQGQTPQSSGSNHLSPFFPQWSLSFRYRRCIVDVSIGTGLHNSTHFHRRKINQEFYPAMMSMNHSNDQPGIKTIRVQ